MGKGNVMQDEIEDEVPSGAHQGARVNRCQNQKGIRDSGREEAWECLLNDAPEPQ